VLAAVLAAGATAEQRFHVYRPLSRTAVELQVPAQASLGHDGTATVDAGGNALVLIGEPRAIQATLALLAELDGPRPTVVLHYESKVSASTGRWMRAASASATSMHRPASTFS
jgi:hypothetical protein